MRSLRFHGFALLFVLTFFGIVSAQAAPPSSKRPPFALAISVFNDARVPTDTLVAAQDQASQIFRRAGLEILWLTCPATNSATTVRCADSEFPHHLHVRILSNSRGLSDDTIGVSFLSADGAGCYADVFYESVVRLHLQHGLDIGALLGHAVAHEVGHLLLGTHSHSEAGIMRARWSRTDLESFSQSTLAFSDLESRRIRAKLLAR